MNQFSQLNILEDRKKIKEHMKSLKEQATGRESVKVKLAKKSLLSKNDLTAGTFSDDQSTTVNAVSMHRRQQSSAVSNFIEIGKGLMSETPSR